MRLTTGIGIAVGGVGGAIAALMGAPQDAAPEQPPALAETPTPPARATAAAVEKLASASASASAQAPASASAAPMSRPTLALPTTREGLHKSMMLCDRKKDFDECTRVSQALELGTTGAADPEGAKRFRKISLTHLVMQCETGNSPHACFVLAAKYRAGTELVANPAGAMALEKRALDLCRFRSAPECPPPPPP